MKPLANIFMNVKLIKAKHNCGCAVACLSMITGIDYDDIISVMKNDFDKQGLKDKKILSYLSDHGFAVFQKTVKYFFNKDDFRGELTKPFAPVHILTMQLHADKSIGHAVVMDADGFLHDPGGFPSEFLKKAYYLDSLFGIYPPNVDTNIWKRKTKSKCLKSRR